MQRAGQKRVLSPDPEDVRLVKRERSSGPEQLGFGDLDRLPSFVTPGSEQYLASLLESQNDEQHAELSPVPEHNTTLLAHGGVLPVENGAWDSVSDSDSLGSQRPVGLDTLNDDFHLSSDDLMVGPDDLEDFDEDLEDELMVQPDDLEDFDDDLDDDLGAAPFPGSGLLGLGGSGGLDAGFGYPPWVLGSMGPAQNGPSAKQQFFPCTGSAEDALQAPGSAAGSFAGAQVGQAAINGEGEGASAGAGLLGPCFDSMQGWSLGSLGSPLDHLAATPLQAGAPEQPSRWGRSVTTEMPHANGTGQGGKTPGQQSYTGPLNLSTLGVFSMDGLSGAQNGAGVGGAGSAAAGPSRAAGGQSSQAASVQCMEEGCSRRRQLAADGSFMYCRQHMLANGGVPARPMCEVQGCDRYAKPSSEPDAPRRFCMKHMVAAGLQPLSTGTTCAHPKCHKLAQLSTTGVRTYCPLHMAKHGLKLEGVACEHTGCGRMASYSSSGECKYCLWHMREHGLQPMARFVACQEPGCRLQSALSSSGVRRYCRAHMAVHGMQPMVDTPCRVEGCTRQAMRGSDAVGGMCRQHARQAGFKASNNPACLEEGCTKVAQYSTCGKRMYCDSHMRAHGQQPRPSRICSHPGCTASARLAAEGQAAYCREHMRAAGLVAAPSNKKKCTHEGCTRYAKRSVTGEWLFCKAHMRAQGIQPAPGTTTTTAATKPPPAEGTPAPRRSSQRRCQKEGCTKWAKRSTTGVNLYCKAHMKEEGLVSVSSIKRCAHPNCTHAAKPDTNGKWLYCKGHMQQYGMWPRDYKYPPGAGRASRLSAAAKAAAAAAKAESEPAGGETGASEAAAATPAIPAKQRTRAAPKPRSTSKLPAEVTTASANVAGMLPGELNGTVDQSQFVLYPPAQLPLQLPAELGLQPPGLDLPQGPLQLPDQASLLVQPWPADLPPLAQHWLPAPGDLLPSLWPPAALCPPCQQPALRMVTDAGPPPVAVVPSMREDLT